MQEDINAIDAVSKAVDRITRKGRFAEFELSNGIVLSMKPVAPFLMNAVLKQYSPPPPPKVFMEEKGREEENPNDPEYQRTLVKLEAEQDDAINNLYLGVGTSFKSAPTGYFRPEEDGWISQVEYAASIAGTTLNIEISDTIKRYLCWLRFYAIETGSDMILARSIPMQLAGISEQEVDEVVEYFRGVSGGRADTEPTPEAGSENGHSTNRAGRRSRT